MGLNETMARLREQAKPKPIEQTDCVTLKLTEVDYTLLRTSLHYLLHGVIRSKLHPKDKSKRITAINELLYKLKKQHLQ
jgi:hypothetical protein